MNVLRTSLVLAAVLWLCCAAPVDARYLILLGTAVYLLLQPKEVVA